VLALALAAVGVYGVMALVVAERTQEVGVRLALGAEPRQVLAMLVGQAAGLAGAGIAVGLGLALVLAPLLASQLYAVAPADPLSLVAAPLALLATALAASVIPARRAMRVDPATALRDAT
jgi:ABC-type antimicrobial peptide transport system permease subunit